MLRDFRRVIVTRKAPADFVVPVPSVCLSVCVCQLVCLPPSLSVCACLCVCPSACISAAPTSRISVKLHIVDFSENLWGNSHI